MCKRSRSISLFVLAFSIAACGSADRTASPSPSDDPESAGGDCSVESCGPRPQMPNHPCPDGVSLAGPACERDVHGSCAWIVRDCPDDATGTGAPAPPEGRMCGGIQGLACGDTEICVYSREARCGAGDQSGTCQPRADACAQIYQPVCGCDGRTYGNECEANRAGTSVASDGECAAAAGGSTAGGTAAGGGRSCGSRGMAPCGPDELCDFPPAAQCGATDRPGVCRARPRNCTRELAPVCGCDGQTHPTRCIAESQGVSVAHDGPC